MPVDDKDNIHSVTTQYTYFLFASAGVYSPEGLPLQVMNLRS